MRVIVEPFNPVLLSAKQDCRACSSPVRLPQKLAQEEWPGSQGRSQQQANKEAPDRGSGTSTLRSP